MQRAAQKRKSKNKMPERFELLATPERAHQQGGVVKDYVGEGSKVGARILRHKAACECKLDGYFAAGKINKSQHGAGLRFRAAWLVKAEGIKTHDSCVPALGGGAAGDAFEKMTYSEKILGQAYGELTQRQALVVTSVCGADELAGDGERLQTLRRGLEALAKLWGIE